MDPSSFTKTSFCNIEIDNITTNDSKKTYIKFFKSNVFRYKI